MAHVTALNVSGFQQLRWPRLVAWLVAAAMLGGGCTTLKSNQLPPEALQAQIRNGSIVQTGDEVSVVTKDGAEQTFIVSAVGTDAIVGTLEGGTSVTVAIDDVLALRTEEISVGRTMLAGVGAYSLVAIALFAIAFHDFAEDFADAFVGAIVGVFGG